MLYNPPLVDRVQGIRCSVVLESQRIATRLLKSGVKTIVFARSRVRTELIATYIRDSPKNFYTDNYGITVQSYRGGSLPNERRAIEKGLRDGSIQGVVSTNAFELGIDIGGLDASILVASASRTDQFVILHPEYFFSRSPENGYIDPGNIFIQIDQLKCAVFELPFADGESFGEGTAKLLGYLSEKGVIRHTGGRWYWANRGYPAENLSLGTSTAENVFIVDTTRGRDEVIGEMDMPSAKLLVFDHAIYIHLGDQFVVNRLDLENRRCFVEETDTDCWTDSIVKTDIKVLAEDEAMTSGGIRAVLGDITLPADEMHTRSAVPLFDATTDRAGRAGSRGELPLHERLPLVHRNAGRAGGAGPHDPRFPGWKREGKYLYRRQLHFSGLGVEPWGPPLGPPGAQAETLRWSSCPSPISPGSRISSWPWTGS